MVEWHFVHFSSFKVWGGGGGEHIESYANIKLLAFPPKALGNSVEIGSSIEIQHEG